MRATGKLPKGKYFQQLKKSPNYRYGAFQNLSPTPMKPEGVSYWKMTREFFRRHPGTTPTVALPSIKTHLRSLPLEDDLFIWFGHSSYYMQVRGKRILVDPVFSGNAAPFSFLVKAFPGANPYTVDDLPDIDFLILTHDHYDHLDYRTIIKLHQRVGHIYCSLGISAHLIYWGVSENRITELDWWESAELTGETQLHAAPARHFSGRGLKRGQSFWSSFILITPEHRYYLGGDSGYDAHFADIGKRFGPFDVAFLEAGQYNTMWPLIHMMPEETVQAAIDLQAKVLVPVHWGKFKLGMHPWTEPVTRVLEKANETGQAVIAPRIGEVVTLPGDKHVNNSWWV